MFAKGLFVAAGRGHRPDEGYFFFAHGKFFSAPDGFHLLARDLPHFLIIEQVLGLFSFRRPQNGFGGVREIAAGKIWRRVGLFPRDVVEDFET